MTNRNAIIASILLIISSILIKVLIKDTNTSLNLQLVGFFSGVLFGVGIAFLIQILFKKK
ncbi:MAG: hypothetical protein A2041_11710 [Bacteroidetes bacterium GWA2_31_9b]|nr:MAG: hypothetical protein A2041_11710 [Bacteroidetes bacterium GWA2_31_9b]